MFGFYNDQRLFLVGQARYLIEQIPDHVSHSELSLVAQALGTVGDHELACHYWENSFEKSPSNYIEGYIAGGSHRICSARAIPSWGDTGLRAVFL